MDEKSFAEARHHVPNANSGGSVLVCDEYELYLDTTKSPKMGRYLHYLLPKYLMKFRGGHLLTDECRWRVYEPLKEEPDLFLKFARLYEQGRRPQAALEWANQYGALTCSLVIHMDRNKLKYEDPSPREQVEDFFEEVDRAATILYLYEAVLSRNEDAVAVLIVHGPSPFLMEIYKNHWLQSCTSEEHGNDLLTFALFALMAEVSRMVRTYAYQQLHIPAELADLPLASRMRQSWSFDNLLGAMYVQMYWLLAAGEKNVTHCLYCRKLISLTRGASATENLRKPRKPRQDKQYCDHLCRQRHYYHTKEKFRRKSQRREK